MNLQPALDSQVHRLGFWSVIVALVTAVVSLFLPLDVPGGYGAEHADRVAWLSAHRSIFIAAWVNQIAAMFSLSAVFACAAWLVAGRNPLRGILAALFVAMAVMAFIIPKFIAVWTIPLLADAITAGTPGADLADPLLRLLNVSVPFSLYTSFDYLGFWLYSVFALLAAGPLYAETTSSRVASVALGLFGLVYQVLMVALILGVIAAPEIEIYFIGASLLLLIHIVPMARVFRRAMSAV